MKRILLIIGALLLSASLIYAIEDCKLLRSPDICSTSIVFAYGGDLWLVGREGGDARRQACPRDPGAADRARAVPSR